MYFNVDHSTATEITDLTVLYLYLWEIMPQISVDYSTSYVGKSLKLIIIILEGSDTFWFIFHSF